MYTVAGVMKGSSPGEVEPRVLPSHVLVLYMNNDIEQLVSIPSDHPDLRRIPSASALYIHLNMTLQ